MIQRLSLWQGLNGLFKLLHNGSYMKRSHTQTLQLSNKLYGYVLYTVLGVFIFKQLILIKMDIIEENKKIAKFMSYNVTKIQWKEWESLAFCDEDGYADFRYINYFEPHQNWGQIMEVLEIIGRLGCTFEIKYSLFVTCRICWICKKHDNTIDFCNDNQKDGFALSQIMSVYKSVVQFINWYENNV